MSEFHNPNKTHSSDRGPDYIWEYEYYDDDEPVSFEGLKAHRYSIVIGFWVGLAVFVIFMFFVLTLLTKTGAPHQENPEQCEKGARLASCVVDISHPQDSGNKVCSRPLLDESRSLFHCYINEEEQGRGRAGGRRGRGQLDGRSSSSPGEAAASSDLQGAPSGHRTDREANFLAHFNIPNFVNSEHSSTLGDDDLLLCEPPIILDSESRPHSAHHILS
ncbi:melanocortin-2 receptor accessory protein 2A [Megalops cyprinoides]|uniref:melanocortin-2 receptor accessory protein 2A n=1 Tax=Megalops cyprinoides TaxID=118141 RepID=UPI001864FF95|nr:melanocortin-2 receptor accessory protein 2A [Megalops cyprinoides]